MIEQAIYFALGCIVTALGALAFAPIFWRRALRLTKRRMQAQAPMSMQEILAERDALRARFAVERVRLEQELERVRARKVADLAEIGRRTAAVATLTDELIALRRLEQAQEREIATLQREANEAVATVGAMGKALHDADALAERHRDRAEAARRAHDTLQQEADERRTSMAALSTRAMGLEMRLVDADRAATARLRAVETEAAARQVDMAAELAKEREAGAAALRQRDEAAAARKAALGEVAEVKAAAGAFAEEVREREKITALQVGSSNERAAETVSRLAALTQENAALRRERDEARAKADLAASQAGTRAPAFAEPGDAELRASIHALGVAVAELTRDAAQAATRDAAQLAAKDPNRASDPQRIVALTEPSRLAADAH